MKKLSKILLIILLITMFTSLSWATDKYSKNIEVYYGVVKNIIIDGIDKTPTENLPFIYNGTTYVPIRYVSESLGKEVTWEGSTGTIYIGKNPEEADYLTDKKIYYHENMGAYIIDNSLIDEKNYRPSRFPSGFIMTMNEKEYAKGISIKPSSSYKSSIVYNLNGEFKSLKGLVGYDDRYVQNSGESDISFYVDDKLIKTIHLERGDFPKELDIDLDYGLQLKITIDVDYYSSPRINFVNMILE